MVGTSQAIRAAKATAATAKRRSTAFVRLRPPREIFVTSGSSRYARITAIATGIKIGWRKAMRLAATQIAEPAITMSRTTKIADSAAHMIFFCQAVGYLLMLCQAQVPRTNSAAQSRRVSGVFSFHLECRRAGSTWRSLQRWTTLLWLAFAHHRLRTLDFLDETFVLGIQSERLLPCFQCLGHALQLQVRVADMLENYGIVARQFFGRTLKIVEGLLDFPLAKFEPAEAVEKRAIVG